MIQKLSYDKVKFDKKNKILTLKQLKNMDTHKLANIREKTLNKMQQAYFSAHKGTNLT